MTKLEQDFYARDTLTVARELLGKHLVRVVDGVPLTLRITETEAYIGRMDKACHAYNYKRTKRTETLFAPPGTAYLYLIYGMYTCLNCVTEAEGEPAAVLIRGGTPIDAHNADLLADKRFGCTAGEMSAYQRKNFLNGPGKLCKALSLTTKENGLSLTGDTLYILDAGETPGTIHTGKRIGIDYAEEAVDFPLEVLSMIFFDLDGTLIDSNGVWRQVDYDFMAKRGLTITEEYIHTVTHSIFPVAAQFTKEHYHLAESAQDIMDEWREMAYDAYTRTIPLKPGARELLEFLSQKGQRIALLTATLPELGVAALARHGLKDYFEGFFFAQEVGLEKKDPEVYRLAAKQFDVAPTECVLVEDAPHNCAAARSVGYTVVGIYDAFYEEHWPAVQGPQSPVS